MSRYLKTKKAFILPDYRGIKDQSVQKYIELLGKLLIQFFKDIYDDFQSLQTAEKVSALPDASANWRGKFLFVDGSGTSDDVLYYCILDSTNSYAWKTVGLS